MILKVVNVSSMPQNLQINLQARPSVSKDAHLILLTGKPEDVNTIDAPPKNCPAGIRHARCRRLFHPRIPRVFGERFETSGQITEEPRSARLCRVSSADSPTPGENVSGGILNPRVLQLIHELRPQPARHQASLHLGGRVAGSEFP